MMPLAVVSCGMFTSVGRSAAATCAALRVGISGAVETGYLYDGDWLVGCPAPIDGAWQGRSRLLRMATASIEECCAHLGDLPTSEVPLLLCVAEEQRPGRPTGVDASMLPAIESRLGYQFHKASEVVMHGRVGGVHALERACALIADGRPRCLVAGVDTFLHGPTLRVYYQQHRLLTDDHSNGFIPGEAAAAVLLGSGERLEVMLRCVGAGHGLERATVESDEPLRGDGLAEALKAAVVDSGRCFDDLDYRLADVSGEQYGFKEASLALSRTMRILKSEFDLWHPADCIGEIGAAIVPCVIGVADSAARKRYAPGPGVLCHFSNDDGRRAAVVLVSGTERAA